MRIKRKLVEDVLELIESFDEQTQRKGRAGDYVDEIKLKLASALAQKGEQKPKLWEACTDIGIFVCPEGYRPRCVTVSKITGAEEIDVAALILMEKINDR